MNFLAPLAAGGIGVGKVQITAGFEVGLPPDADRRQALTRQLQPFTCSPYLHQVIGDAGGGCPQRFPDLAPALPHQARNASSSYRIHYHMPLYVEHYRHLGSTCDDTCTVLTLLRDRKFTRHLEIEIYTWEWLPLDLKVDLLDSLHRE